MSDPVGPVERRQALLAEAEQIRAAGFTPERRERFDNVMEEIDQIDGRRSETADPAAMRRAALGMGCPAEFLDTLEARGLSIEEKRSAIFAELFRRDQEIPTHTGFAIQEDRGSSDLSMMADGLAARVLGKKPRPEAREYARASIVDLARRCLEGNGVSTRMMSNGTVITRALHTSSDFPILLQGTGARVLREAFNAYQGGVRRICRESTARDFRPKTRVQLGEAPILELVNEHGEVTRGSMAEAKASYSLQTFAKIFGITRQALVNDDLSAFGDMTQRLGRAAAEFVAAQLAAKLASNPTMDDGIALFHASHGNLGTAAAISVDSLGEALKMMRLQKGLDGVTPIDVAPRYLVVPAAKEVLARQYVAQINAQKASDVNPFSADLDVVVEPRLDTASATAWYLAADVATIDTIEYSYLEDEPGPMFETRSGFDVEGVEFKVRLDFGCGVLEHRGLFKNAGT